MDPTNKFWTFSADAQHWILSDILNEKRKKSDTDINICTYLYTEWRFINTANSEYNAKLETQKIHNKIETTNI